MVYSKNDKKLKIRTRAEPRLSERGFYFRLIRQILKEKPHFFEPGRPPGDASASLPSSVRPKGHGRGLKRVIGHFPYGIGVLTQAEVRIVCIADDRNAVLTEPFGSAYGKNLSIQKNGAHALKVFLRINACREILRQDGHGNFVAVPHGAKLLERLKALNRRSFKGTEAL